MAHILVHYTLLVVIIYYMYYVCETQKMLENVVKRSESGYTREQRYTKVIIIIIIYKNISKTERIACVNVFIFYFLLLLCHMGLHTPSSEDSPPFVEGGYRHARNVSCSKQSPHDYAAHNNIVMQPRCICLRQCVVVTQPKPIKGCVSLLSKSTACVSERTNRFNFCGDIFCIVRRFIFFFFFF